MERFLYNQLKNWKDSKTRKPLILEGARQVGKTWLLKQFGKNEFENFIYINCDNNPQMESLFVDYDVKRILRNLSAISNIKIESGKCFIVFDEVQEFPKALTSLKYFCEDAPEIHVAATLTGLQRVPTRMWAKADKSARILPAKFLSRQDVVSFPVGKVDSLYLYPLSYM
ncbi:AAA family ATPase, partial [uncultured Treponema sp.]|uniref:AAA family ATPase n=1 Tax=uncultured Treponema sp. TaxID=162155 RepID=UPI00261F3DBE